MLKCLRAEIARKKGSYHVEKKAKLAWSMKFQPTNSLFVLTFTTVLGAERGEEKKHPLLNSKRRRRMSMSIRPIRKRIYITKRGDLTTA